MVEIFLLTVTVFIFGVLIGYAISVLVNHLESASNGTLRVDHSDPSEPPYFFLELSKDGQEKIFEKNYIVLRIVRKNFISHD